jgi:hypothetical protein
VLGRTAPVWPDGTPAVDRSQTTNRRCIDIGFGRCNFLPIRRHLHISTDAAVWVASCRPSVVELHPTIGMSGLAALRRLGARDHGRKR